MATADSSVERPAAADQCEWYYPAACLIPFSPSNRPQSYQPCPIPTPPHPRSAHENFIVRGRGKEIFGLFGTSCSDSVRNSARDLRTLPNVMESSTSITTMEKLLRHYSEAKEADIVFRIRYRREQAGSCVLFELEKYEELAN